MPATLEEILDSHKTRRPVVVGILNVTPDSFSDGGKFLDPAAAVARADEMMAQGADLIDVGAESTRPGSERVPPLEQIDRLANVLPELARRGIPYSIDTTSSQVARFALEHRACLLNDISAGREDPALLPMAAKAAAPIVLMHMQGLPKTMQLDPRYADVAAEVKAFLRERRAAALDAGVSPRRIILDPGIGFGKTLEHNLKLLAHLQTFAELDCPILVGASRKRFIAQLTDHLPGGGVADRRVFGTVGACLWAWHEGATIFRVHDVGELAAALAVAKAIEQPAHRKPRG